MRRIIATAIAFSFLASCGGGEDPAVRDDERAAGAEAHPQLLAEFGGAYEAPEAAYVRALGQRIAAAANLEGQCTFTLVNSDVVNAFATPGCYIYVTRGMMAVVNSEAELASVLGHEVGHIVAAHSRRQQRRSLLRGLGVAAVEAVTGSERLTRLAGAAAGFFTLRYSRKQEYEADDLGIRFTAAAGFDPHAASDMLAALGRQEEFQARTRGHDAARSIPEWARTHPLAGNRIERAAGTASATGIADDQRPENEARYLAEVDGLLYGDDPAQGFVLGRRFAHPVMRIGFEAPPGFTLTNSPQSIMIEGPGGARGEFAGGRMPPGGLEAHARGVLNQLLGSAGAGIQAELGAAQETAINGVPALIVPAVVRTREGDVMLTVAAYAGGGAAVYHFLLATPASAEARASIEPLIRSFRLLSPQEAASLRPRFVRTVPVPAGGAAALTRLMATDQPLDHFLMLNGLAGAGALRPGDRVKIVVR
ncbi:MAG TPA: M48 family metalloprotease [Allosphingosinicella sp.]|jgi:predicted Zn-dependent protease